ncbi:MAG: hypothetical protein ACYTG0_08750 [Planctomycetota bacterium]|jgi:hypothetical protein
MLSLEIVVLLLAFAAAIFGIWTQPERNNATATITTTVMTVGLVAAAGLAIWNSINAKREAIAAEQKRQDQLRTILSGTELTHLRIIWSFENVPEDILLIFGVGDLMVDSQLLANEDIDRLPADVESLAVDAWRFDYIAVPLIAAIDKGAVDFDAWYDGEEPTAALERFSANKDDWVEGIGSDIDYVGPNHHLVFPLNLQLNAALSLGEGSDDVVSKEPQFGWQEDIPYLFGLTNYGFKVRADTHDSGFQLTWTYGRASLLRAVERSEEDKLTAGLPARFSFVIARRPLERKEYLSRFATHFQLDETSDEAEDENSWDRKSTIEVYVNGIKETSYTFDVTKAGTIPHYTDLGAYEEPELEHEYTRFDCTLRGLQ